MKIYISLILFLVSLFILTPSIYAQEGVGTGATKRLERQEDRITDLKNRANREIDRRIEKLTDLMNKISNAKHLTSDQISSLTASIQTEINNLTALKTKIAADTDLATLRSDVQSIVKSYRVYVLYIPKIAIMFAGNRIIDIVTKMTDPTTGIVSKLQTRLQGNTDANLQADLTDMQAKLTDAKTQAQNAINTVSSLTPDGYPANVSILQNARSMLQTARQDIVSAIKDAKMIIQGLHAMNKPTPAK
jgi:predicted  nucleic acid-binding Zn-ribbon protein